MKRFDTLLLTYLLFDKIYTQNEPDKQKMSDIIKYKADRGISPADK